MAKNRKPKKNNRKNNNTSEKFELVSEKATVQPSLPLKPNDTPRPRVQRRKKDSVRLRWDTKPKRPPSPRDIDFQIAEVVIPNPARDEGDLPFSFHDGILGNEEIDRMQMNRLIWGDNLLAMQALLTQGYEGKIDLIYIDPPFDSKSDYSHRMEINGNSVIKEPSIIERLAYSDTWEGGIDSYLDMLYPRLQLMKRLLSNTGSIYVHCDWHASHYIKIIMDEIFGRGGEASEPGFRSEIIWKSTSAHSDSTRFGSNHQTILYYTKSTDWTWNKPKMPYDQEYIDTYFRYKDPDGRRFKSGDLSAYGLQGGGYLYEWNGHTKPWRCPISTMQRLHDEGKIYYTKNGVARLKQYLDESDGLPAQTIWADKKVQYVVSWGDEKLTFDTQKSEGLLERIIQTSSADNEIIADFFCGSGTTLSVAEKLGRRWIGCDFGKVGIQVTRSRLVKQDTEPFLIENIGNYQREMIYLTGGRIYEMQRIILKLYGATLHPNYKDLGTRQVTGTRGGTRDVSFLRRQESSSSDSLDRGNKMDPCRSTGDIHSQQQVSSDMIELVYVGYPDRPTTARKVEELTKQAETLDGTGYKRLIILAWDYDYNFDSEWEARKKALKRKLEVEVACRMIPPDVYDYLKKAKDEAEIEKLSGKIVFHEKPFLKLSKPKIKKTQKGQCEITIGLDKYVIFDLPVAAKQREALRRAMKDNFAILIDYWAVDWDYDGATFRSEWQALRGNGKRAKVVSTSITHTLKASQTYTIAVRVVDVFGNDAAATCQINT